MVIEPVEMTMYTICGGFDTLNHHNLYIELTSLFKSEPRLFVVALPVEVS